MADVGGVIFGYAVSKLLDEVLIALKHLDNRSANLLQLQNLLERLQPSVKELSSFVQDKKHPAAKWVTKLHEQLEKSRDLVTTSRNVNRNIFKLYRTSKESLEVYESIQALLLEAAALQWASGMSIQRIATENDARILVELTAAKERDEQLFRRIADIPSKSDILSTIFKSEQVQNSEIFDGSSSSAVPTEKLEMDSFCHVPKPKLTFGGDAVARKLINHLLNRDCKKWIGLWGMGGIGKTFTASKVYHDFKVRRHFSGGIFWLSVSKDQPGPKHLFKQLLEKIEGRGPVSVLPDNLELAKSYLKSMLKRDRVLLVLDDVWQKDVLNHLDVISESKRGVILVTTRDQGILRSVIDLVKIFEIPRLSPEDSWQLFSYHAFPQRVVPLELDAVAKNVAEECQGLPLALEVIGSTMRDRELVPAQKALGQTTLRVWEIALERLRSANYGNNEYEALYLKLQLSVDSLLEEDSRLQDCFFYFAAFPEDEEVRVDDLVRIWIAEGLVQDDVNSSFSGEEEGKFLLGFLAAKSMIEVTRAGCGCKVHDVMRDLAQRNLKRNLATGEEIQASARDCLYAPGLKESKLPHEWTLSGFPSYARKLSLRGNDLQQFPEPQQFKAPHLQVLILSSNRGLESLSTKFFQNLSNLKVLDLNKTNIKRIPGAVLRGLKSLVLFDLRGCENLVEVSDEINRLCSLEFLLLDKCSNLQKLPRVNNLTNLKWFSGSMGLKVEGKDAHDSSGWWQGWRPWTHHGRSRCGIPYVLPANLKALQLEGDISMGGKYSFDVSSLQAIEKLTLRNTSCPAGMEELHHLKKLDLRYCYKVPVRALGKLRRLEHLVMGVVSNLGKKFSACEGEFTSLKTLEISCSDRMEEMILFHRGTMPMLESLKVDLLGGLRLPSMITELRSLKHLSLKVEYGCFRSCNLEFVFSKPNCFPHLYLLSIAGLRSLEEVRQGLPGHLVEREKQGNLKLECINN